MSNNPLAFPRPGFEYPAGYEDGMTLRDWFAVQALSWALSNDYGNDWGKSGTQHIPLAVAKSYRVADAMLAERERSA